MKLVCKGIMAGIFIGLGGTVYLMMDNKILGAMLFAIGLFGVFITQSNLYTGKVGFLIEEGPIYALQLIPMWLSNFVGTALVACAVSLTRYGPELKDKAKAIVEIKLNDDFLSLLMLGLGCGMMMYLAAYTFKTYMGLSAVQIMGTIFPVMVFILAGFEHCVANMFYFTLAGVMSGDVILRLLMMTLGNSLGSLIVYLLTKIWDRNTGHYMVRHIDPNDPEDFHRAIEEIQEYAEEALKAKEEEEKKNNNDKQDSE